MSAIDLVPRPDALPDFDTPAANREPGSLDSRQRVSELLTKASRTFALNIPLLPEPLRHAMGVGYLLMRNADSVEDAYAWSREDRVRHLQRFIGLMRGPFDPDRAERFVRGLPDLGDLEDAGHAEVLLETPFVYGELFALPVAYAAPIRRNVLRVAERMTSWVRRHDDDGHLELHRVRELDEYCYDVAGIVGEMITELIEASDPFLEEEVKLALRSRAVDFGIGLQLVNIVKDSWRDAQEGRRYLPAAFLPQADEELRRLDPIVELAASRLDRGLEYTLAIPASEPGIRRFCLLALVLAAATLHEVAERAGELAAGGDVKISRERVGRLLYAAVEHAPFDGAVRALWAEVRAPLDTPVI